MRSPLQTLVLLCLLALPARGDEPDSMAEGTAAPGRSHVGESFDDGPRQAAEKLDGTGDVHFPITTGWSRGQTMFDQGVGQLHGFWYYEAERTFRQIAAEDSECAMAYWGMAMANWENSKRAKGFIQEAVAKADGTTPRERLWIEAQAAFLGDDPKDIKERRKKLVEALENIIHQHPDDVEAKAFLVVRLWQFDGSGIPINSHQATDALLDQVFASNPRHPAHHYRIHLWDKKKPQRALGSAAVLHATAPTIAHMWHMPGHVYDKLKRYPESAYHQEASARVDHRLQAETFVLPDTIHNYAHNNEWLVRNWNHLGRAADAIAMAKGMIDNPMHPKLNHFGKSNSSASHGRQRLFESLERFERWDEILNLAETRYLAPTDDPGQQAERLLRIGRAQFELGQKEALTATRDALTQRVEDLESKRASQEEEAEAKALDEGKDETETEKRVSEATRKTKEELKLRRRARDELTACIELLEGSPLDDERAKKIRREKPALALLHLRFGEVDRAKTTAAEAVSAEEDRVVPLAVQAHVLEQAGEQDGAAEVFNKLKILSHGLDLDAAPFARLAPLAERLGEPADWRNRASWRDADFGPDKPAQLDHLGPLAYRSPDAPDFELLGEDGTRVSLPDFAGRPMVVMLYIGHTCSHCVEQLNTFAPLNDEFAAAGIELIAASPEPPADLANAHDLCTLEDKRFPFPLYSDTSLATFRAYRAFDDFEGMEMHGTFLIGPDGKLRWMDVGPEPFMDAAFLLRESQRLLGM
ncbi:hypothetical protein BH23VER1_BH23VER1_07100 [soil metagenome]